MNPGSHARNHAKLITASFDCVGIFRDSVLRIPCFRGVRNHRPLQQKPMLTVIVYSTETRNTQYGITEYSNAVKTRCTADFTCVEQLVYSVAWPYTCNSITESRHGVNQLFNASEIRCTADFSCVRKFHDCVKRSVASSVALYTTETIQVDSSC